MATPASSLVHDVYEKDKIKSGLKAKYFELQVIDSQNGDKYLTKLSNQDHAFYDL